MGVIEEIVDIFTVNRNSIINVHPQSSVVGLTQWDIFLVHFVYV